MEECRTSVLGVCTLDDSEKLSTWAFSKTHRRGEEEVRGWEEKLEAV